VCLVIHVRQWGGSYESLTSHSTQYTGFPLTWKVGIFLVRESQGKVREFCWQSGKTGHDYIHVAWVLSSVVVTDQLRHTRSFIGAYSSQSTLSVIVLVFITIMAMERSRCRGGGADYKLHKTSSSICIGSGNSSKHSQGKVREFHFWIWVGTL